MNSTRLKEARVVLQLVIFAVAVGAGAAVFALLLATKPEPPRVEREILGTLVEVEPVRAMHHELVVTAQGTVVPARRVVVVPQVTGRVNWLSDRLVPGGRFTRGDRIFRIEASDYEVALERSAADVERARVERQLEQGRRIVAEREWELFGGEANEESRARALREPQLRSAEVAIEAAQSNLRRAQLDLGRTTIRAPFDVVVQSENVDLGQVISQGTQVATLVGIDAFWIEASVSVEALSRIDVPGYNATEGSAVRIRQDASDRHVERQGRVLRLFGDLDPVGRFARLLVEVRDPLERDGNDLPLLLGAYVRVEIDARSPDRLTEIPRSALREGDRVWLAAANDELAIRDVRVAWRRDETVLISEGLADGDRVIVSSVPTPVAGMMLRIESSPDETRRADAAGDEDTGEEEAL